MSIIRKYTAFDMVRMANFSRLNPELKPMDLMRKYVDTFPEISEEQKKANIMAWVNKNIKRNNL